MQGNNFTGVLINTTSFNGAYACVIGLAWRHITLPFEFWHSIIRPLYNNTVKVKVTLEQATKAQRGRKCRDLPFL
jgi:hypothetical protein